MPGGTALLRLPCPPPAPWTLDDPDMKSGRTASVRDADGHALAYVYFEDKPRRRTSSPATRRGASRSTSLSCSTCCRER